MDCLGSFGYPFHWCICTSTIYPSVDGMKKNRAHCTCTFLAILDVSYSSIVISNLLRQSEHPLVIWLLHHHERVSKEALTIDTISIPQPPAILEGHISNPCIDRCPCVTSVCTKSAVVAQKLTSDMRNVNKKCNLHVVVHKTVRIIINALY